MTDFTKNELMGHLRTALMQLQQAGEGFKEAWEGEELMLNPREASEVRSLLMGIKANLIPIEEYAGQFEKLAGARKVTE